MGCSRSGTDPTEGYDNPDTSRCAPPLRVPSCAATGGFRGPSRRQGAHLHLQGAALTIEISTVGREPSAESVVRTSVIADRQRV